MDDAEKELTLRLYRWSLAEAQHEVEAGYPLLKLFWDDLVALYLYITEVQDLEKQMLQATANVKRGHPQAVRLTGQPMITAEQEVLEYTDALILHHIAKGSAYKLRHGQKELEQWPPLSGRSIVSVLRSKMAGIDKAALGKRQHITSTELNYEKEIGDWQFRTTIATRRTNFECVHGLVRTADTSTYKAAGEFPLSYFSYCSLLGVSSLGWKVFNTDDTELASVGLVAICTKMLNDIPPLLAGL